MTLDNLYETAKGLPITQDTAETKNLKLYMTLDNLYEISKGLPITNDERHKYRPGDRATWKDGVYEKQGNGTWRKVSKKTEPGGAEKSRSGERKKATEAEYLIDNEKSATREWLEAQEVQSLEVFMLDKPLTSDKIIAKVGGGDKTDGSCSSAALAYAANRAGFDVTDFRGGMSRFIFADMTTIRKIAELNGVKSKRERQYDDFAGVGLLKKEMEIGKEYFLAAGEHAAIVRKTESLTFEYLELQRDGTLWTNGFKLLTDDALEKRFGCKRINITEDGIEFKKPSVLIDIESLGKNREFVELMKYINTGESEQLKWIEVDAK